MGKKVILSFFMAIFLFSIASAAIVQTTQGADTLFIEYQKFDYFKIGEPFQVNAHVYNQTGYILTNETVNCSFHAYNSNGSHAIDAPMLYDEGGEDFYLDIPGEAFTGGKASWIISCMNGAYGGFASGKAIVTTTGFELSTAQSILYVISFMFLMVIFLLLLYGRERLPRDEQDEEGKIVKVSHLEALRPVMLGLAWIVLTAITFIVANVMIGYMQTGLMGQIIFGIFKLMMLSNLIIIPIWVIWMFQRIALSKEMIGFIERGVPCYGK